MTSPIKKTFRWLVYLILIILVPPLLQTFAANTGETGAWWIWFPAYLFFGWWAVLSIIFAVASICPSPRYPNLIFLGIFLVGEISFLYFNGAGSNALEVILRLGTDLQIIIGILAGAFAPYDFHQNSGS